MPINARTKGSNGEREIALSLNGLIGTVMRELGYPEAAVVKGFTQVQRNQNQSAVGGKDLVGTFDLAIEVKRCETLELTKWWAQACASAKRDDELPVLLYRQNRGPWRCRMWGVIPVDGEAPFSTHVDISWDQFVQWFKMYVRAKLHSGERIAA